MVSTILGVLLMLASMVIWYIIKMNRKHIQENDVITKYNSDKAI